MRKISLLFILIVLLFNVVHAQEDDLQNRQNLIIDIDVSSEAMITPKSSDYSVKYIKVNLSHFPYESFNQEVTSFDTNPDAAIENNALLFDWDNPQGQISFGYNTQIKTNNNIITIKEKIPFPLLNIPKNIKQYTEVSETIDSNDEEIIKLASKLVEGEDDLYVVIYKIAEWTKNNIEYDLSTLTAEVSQKASWVLTNKQGVCDELTSLFIAMLRSVGIPAKFISGIAYTSSPLFPENWGSHGWAEVYFPDYGWVPYDVTYGQFGYIDPTHVKLKESVDSAEPSVQYKWISRNVELETKKLDIDTTLKEAIGITNEPISLDVNVLNENIGFGSYNLVEVTLENLADYYISTEIYISRPEEVELTENFIKNTLLKPKEKKSIFWIVKLTNNLQSSFIYTFPITISTLRNSTAKTSFTSTKNDIIYSLQEINNILDQRQEEEQKTYSKEVDINCDINKKEFYSYENNLINCKITNLGNVILENLNLCLDKECKKFDLGISQKKDFNFSVKNFKEGKQALTLNLKNIDISKASYIDVDILDKPEIKIQEIIALSTVLFDDQFKIEFLLNKQSVSNPHNVEITLSHKNLEKTWIVKELHDPRKFIINLLGKDLRKGPNVFSIDLIYEDKNKQTYKTKETFVVELVNVTLTQNFILMLNSFIAYLENITLIKLVFVTLGSLAIFILILHFIFRKNK
jgi:transglutaminase-like putative cysteine protease